MTAGMYNLSGVQQVHTPLSGLRPQFSLASSSGSKGEAEQMLTGTKRPRRMAAMKINKEDSQDPYIYTTNTRIVNRRARGAAQNQG